MHAAIDIRALAWASAATVLAVACGAVALRLAAEGPSPWDPDFSAMGIAGAVTFGLPGALAAAHAPRNAIGWLMLAIGLCLGVAELCGQYADRALRVEPGVLPAGEAALWVSQWLWVPGFGLVPTLLLLLFPDGRLPAPRWWPLAATGATGIATATLSWATTPYADLDVPPPYPGTESLLASAGLSEALGWGAVLLLVAAAGSLASLAVRLRRSRGLERRQVLLVLIGGALTVALLAVGAALGGSGAPLAAAAMVPLPAAIAVAVLRHGLWDAELSIRRALARAMFGDRDEPYALMRRLGDRLEAAAAPAEAVAGIAEAVARALGARHAAVKVDGLPELAGAFGDGGAERAVRVPLQYAGEVVGELAVTPAGELTPADRRALDALARQAAAAVHAARLDADLERSRRRALAAAEEERRRLRRDLHDELGPTLAAVALQLEMLRDAPRGDAEALLDAAIGSVRAGVADVRRIVHDLRPPALDDLGLEGALAGQAAAFAPLDVRVEAAVGPLPAAVEVAAYRIAREALANTARHAGARSASVSLRADGDALRLEVRDDGRGFAAGASEGVGLRSMRERVAALGGRLVVESGAAGTTVSAELPLEAP